MRDLKYMVEVMQAALEGKRIEYNCNDGSGWDTASDKPPRLAWNWQSFDYRIAPEPRKAREWRIPVYNGQPFLYNQSMPPSGEFVVVREVLPEDNA